MFGHGIGTEGRRDSDVLIGRLGRVSGGDWCFGGDLVDVRHRMAGNIGNGNAVKDGGCPEINGAIEIDRYSVGVEIPVAPIPRIFN